MDRRYLYLLSFLEGSAVMACELIGAKVLAPYFGTSLYVWAGTLGITLGGLMIGYFAGGKLSRLPIDQNLLLLRMLIGAGIFTALIPLTGPWIMDNTLEWSLSAGTVVSLLVFLAPPLIGMGMVSPLIINLLNEEIQAAGNSSGNVYAISTFGGILTTFLMGFYIIPVLGVSYPAVLTGAILAAGPVVSLARRGRPGAILAILCFLFCWWQVQQRIENNPNQSLVYHSEGVMGQIKVVDRPLLIDGRQVTGRSLIVNNSLQSVRILEQPTFDFYPYTKYIPAFASHYTENSRVLILGLGGGTLVSRLTNQGFQVDVVDIDSRLQEIALEHFSLPPQTNIIIDDARHYLRTCSKEYDLIIYDTFLSESAPEYMLTLEGIADAGRCLSSEGSLLINFYGHLEGPAGKIVRSVLKTIMRCGLDCRLFSTPGSATERNIIFVAGRDGHRLQHLTGAGGSVLVENRTTFPDQMAIDTSDAILLTDDRPQQGLYARAAAEWRRRYNQEFTRQFSKLRKY